MLLFLRRQALTRKLLNLYSLKLRSARSGKEIMRLTSEREKVLMTLSLFNREEIEELEGEVANYIARLLARKGDKK